MGNWIKIVGVAWLVMLVIGILSKIRERDAIIAYTKKVEAIDTSKIESITIHYRTKQTHRTANNFTVPASEFCAVATLLKSAAEIDTKPRTPEAAFDFTMKMKGKSEVFYFSVYHEASHGGAIRHYDGGTKRVFDAGSPALLKWSQRFTGIGQKKVLTTSPL